MGRIGRLIARWQKRRVDSKVERHMAEMRRAMAHGAWLPSLPEDFGPRPGDPGKIIEFDERFTRPDGVTCLLDLKRIGRVAGAAWFPDPKV